MNAETVTAYALSISGIVAIVVQLIKEGLIDPRVQESPARNALLRALTYALNLGALLGIVALNGQLNGHDALLYMSLAFGQSLASHVAYTSLSRGASPLVADRANDDITEPS